MIINKIEFKNINSYGNNIQTLEFDNYGQLVNLQGVNGAGKCLHPNTIIEIEIEDKEIEKKFLEFLKNRKNPLLPI